MSILKILPVVLFTALVSCGSQKTLYKEQVSPDRRLSIYLRKHGKELFYCGFYVFTIDKKKHIIVMDITKDGNCDTLSLTRNLPVGHPKNPTKDRYNLTFAQAAYDSSATIPVMEEEIYLLRRMLELREKNGSCANSRLHTVTAWRERHDKRH